MKRPWKERLCWGGASPGQPLLPLGPHRLVPGTEKGEDSVSEQSFRPSCPRGSDSALTAPTPCPAWKRSRFLARVRFTWVRPAFAVFGALTLQALLPTGGVVWLTDQLQHLLGAGRNSDSQDQLQSQKPPLTAPSGHSFARSCKRHRVLWLWSLRAEWPVSLWACGEGGTSTEPPLGPSC